MVTDQTDIFDACRRGDVALVERIYEVNPAIIHVDDFKGFSPLTIAVYNNQLAVVEFLLSKGARAEMQDQAGNTALMGVCFRGYKDLVPILLKSGPDVNQRNYQGATALTFAATFGHLEIAQALLEKGADINIADARGKTPLDHAISQDNEEMLELFKRYQKE